MTRKKPSKSRVRSPPKLPAAENQVLNYLVSLPGAQDEVSPEVLDQIFGSLGEILRRHPQLWPFSRHFFSSARSPLDRLLVGGVPPTKVARLDPPSTQADSAFPILSCCYWLVRAHPHFFHALWDWSALFPLLNSSNISPASKFLVTQILGEVFALNDLTRQRLFLGAHDKSSSPSRDQYHDLSLDLLLPSKKNPSKIALDVVSAKSGIAESRLITVESIPLLRLNLKSESTPSGSERDLILTDSLRRKLRDLALSVLRETPVLLTGPVGSGKTSLVEHLAKVSGHQEHVDFHRIQVQCSELNKFFLLISIEKTFIGLFYVF